jgi:alpha-L-fucosidase 2
MDTAEAEVAFREGTTRYERAVFVSRTDDLAVIELSKVGTGGISVRLALSAHNPGGDAATQYARRAEGVNAHYENQYMYFSARNDNGTDYGAVARVTFFGGSLASSPEGLSVTSADKVLILVRVFVEGHREKDWPAAKAALAANKLTYEKLLKPHAAVHAKLLSESDLDLLAEPREASVEELLLPLHKDGELQPALAEKLWAYGRYLSVCAVNTQGGIVMHPEGLWAFDAQAQGSDYDYAALTALYAHVLPGGMGDLLLPVFTFFEGVIDDLKKNASRLYGCRGILVPPRIAPGSGLPGGADADIVHVTSLAGKAGKLFYDYALTAGDDKFLKTRALPFLREVALFYTDFLTEKGGKRIASPTLVESVPANLLENDTAVAISRATAEDYAVAREVLTALISGCTKTQAYKDEEEGWIALLEKIPACRIGSDGTVKEFLDPAMVENPAAGGLTQLYPLFPGTEGVDKTEALFKGFAVTLKKRFATAVRGMSVGQAGRLAGAFAALRDGEGALDALAVLARATLEGNLLTRSGDLRGGGAVGADNGSLFDLSGNTLLTAVTTNMLVSSREGRINILPALPAGWQRGTVQGVRTRVGVETDVTWDGPKHTVTVRLRSRKATECELQLPDGYTRVRCGGDKTTVVGGLYPLKLGANKVTEITIN